MDQRHFTALRHHEQWRLPYPPVPVLPLAEELADQTHSLFTQLLVVSLWH
jgi:hypothetical protein